MPKTMFESLARHYYRLFGGRFFANKYFQEIDSKKTNIKNVVSFSLFGNDSRYVDGAMLNIQEYGKYFPDFVCRFYVSRDLDNFVLKELSDSGSEVFIMNGVGHNFNYTLWRFLASDDISKDIFLIRDIDSAPSLRERTLYSNWLRSCKEFNIIRDHYSHHSKVMAGMWGGRTQHEFMRIFLRYLWIYPNQYNRDQLFLSGTIYPKIINKTLVQDIIQRYENEIPDISEIDNDMYSFVGEIATDIDLRNQWRADFKRQHEDYVKNKY